MAKTGKLGQVIFLIGSRSTPRDQEFGVSTRRLCTLGQRASARVPTRHAGVRAPHVPVRQCELILALALGSAFGFHVVVFVVLGVVVIVVVVIAAIRADFVQDD